MDNTAAPAHSALLRNAVHAGAFLIFAFPMAILADPRNRIPHGPQIVIGFMLFVTLLNMFLLPRLPTGRQIARPGEGFVTGQWLYPLALTICFCIYPAFAAMAAWAAMAGGDAFAGLVGRTVGGPRLPWNKKKTWSGLGGFIIAALPFAVFSLYICPSMQFLKADRTPELPYVWALAVLAACSGAVLESIDAGFDDNMSVPLGVGAVLFVCGRFLSFATRGLPADTHVQPERFLHALAANGTLAIAVVLLRFADVAGTILGALIGTVVYFFAGWQGYALFLLFVACGSLLSKVGYATKQARGAAEERSGTRGIGNVAANLLVPAACCLAYPVYGGRGEFLIAFAGSIAAAFADTASSEIGALSGGAPVLITTFKPVKHGINGAVTLLGFVAAFFASAAIAAVAWETGFFELVFHGVGMPGKLVLTGAIVVAGMAGTIVDSILGATIEDRWPGVGKGAVNMACTLSGAIVAGTAAFVLRSFFE